MRNEYFDNYLKTIDNSKKMKNAFILFSKNQFLGNINNLFNVLLIVDALFFAVFFLSHLELINYDIMTFRIGYYSLPFFVFFYNLWCFVLGFGSYVSHDTYIMRDVTDDNTLSKYDLKKSRFNFLNLISIQALIVTSFYTLYNYLISHADLGTSLTNYFNLFTLIIVLFIFFSKLYFVRKLKKELKFLGLNYGNETQNSINLINYYDKKDKTNFDLSFKLDEIKSKMWSTKEGLKEFLKICSDDKYFNDLDYYKKIYCQHELNNIKLQFESKDNLKLEDKIYQEINKLN